MTKTHEVKFEILQHAPYTPYLAPLDFGLSSYLKKLLGSDSDVIARTNEYFAGFEESVYREGIQFE